MQTRRAHVHVCDAKQHGTCPGKMHGQSLLPKQPTHVCVSRSQIFLLPLVQLASPKHATHRWAFVSQ
jgi:hypothetical protein